MDYKKAYNEALQRAKKFKDEYGGDYAGYIFPELADSPYEKIRKKCISAVNIAASVEGGLLHSEASECLAWLEEQKDKNCLACDQHLKGYIAGRKVTEEEKQKEQKPAEWSEEDEKYLNRVINLWVNDFGEDSDTVKWLKSLRPSQKLNEEEIKKIRSEEYTKGFNDAAFGGKLKEWSVEDEDRIRQIERIAQQAGCTQKLQEEIHNWLKSLRPHWKPSKEQMKALESCGQCNKQVYSLYLDLKKL